MEQKAKWQNQKPNTVGNWINIMSDGVWRVIKIVIKNNDLVVNGSNLKVKYLDDGKYYGPLFDPEKMERK
jgi:hypothetical protein